MEALEHTTETPERLWTRDMALATADELAHLASTARTSQVLLGTCKRLPMHAWKRWEEVQS